MAIIDEEEE